MLDKINTPRMRLGVMYNACHGGFSFSQAAIDEYNRRKDPSTPVLDVHTHCVDRSDPLMIDICSEMGYDANGLYANIQVDYIPLQYKDHFIITEYDGYESVNIDYNGYMLDQIKNVLNNESATNDHKIEILLEIVNANMPPSSFCIE